uniref:DNA polymerase type B n=1 Tax=Amanita thiersii TaxID=235537 RepID=A0A5Q0N2K1_9AGAR|nr:DNA polymerase type B [Amanita thiersii]QFZ98733.1 DNA polymerase type B [Amanita thiersii]
MMQFKNNSDIFYSDTDSIFTSKPLPSEMIGSELGLMKDELGGKLIKEAYFFDIKKYGYWYEDNNKLKVEKSVFAGLKRNSLTFAEIIEIFNGKQFIKEIPLRFYKSFKDLNIRIGSSEITIEKTNMKKLVDNQYQPLKINHLNLNLENRSFIKYLINKIKIHRKIYKSITLIM